MLAFGKFYYSICFISIITNQCYDLSISAHGGLVVIATCVPVIRGYICYGVATGVEDGDIPASHNQDFMASNGSEHMAISVVAYIEDLPGG